MWQRVVMESQSPLLLSREENRSRQVEAVSAH